MEVYDLDQSFVITSYVAGLLHPANILIADHISVKGGLKVIDCIVLSAEYWCPDGTVDSHSTKYIILKSRAVVFRLFQKTVILPPNPVGFRLTYTQL